jgi:hypothetical protein
MLSWLQIRQQHNDSNGHFNETKITKSRTKSHKTKIIQMYRPRINTNARPDLCKALSLLDPFFILTEWTVTPGRGLLTKSLGASFKYPGGYLNPPAAGHANVLLEDVL